MPKDKAEPEGIAFTWEEARFVFVVVFSHAEATINIKEGAFNLGPGNKVISGKFSIKDLEQGKSTVEVQLCREGESVRSIVWLCLILCSTPQLCIKSNAM